MLFEVDEVVGVGQEPVHRDSGALMRVLCGARWQQVERAAEVSAGEESGIGQQPVGVADAAVEDDEGVPVVGGPDEHIGDVQKRQGGPGVFGGRCAGRGVAG